ncbi:MAG: PAS domain-containing protein [Acidimicrobiia bacterium]|nr:PAS domain-containing protein [Acidimicrobiia bacterium]
MTWLVVAAIAVGALVLLGLLAAAVDRRRLRVALRRGELLPVEDGTGVCRLDRRGRVVSMNLAARALLGRGPETLREPGALASLLRAGEGAGDRRVARTDGSEVAVHLRRVPVRRGTLFVLRDRREVDRMRSEVQALEERLVQASARADVAERDLEREVARADLLADRLDAAAARADEPEQHPERLPVRPLPGRTPTAGSPATLRALWALERLRQAREWGSVAPPVPAGGDDLSDELRAAIELELAMLRDEIGTDGDLVEDWVDAPIPAASALAALRVAQEVMGAVAKRADKVDVGLRADSGGLVLTLAALSWKGAVEQLSSLGVLSEAVEAVNGKLHVDRHESRLVVILELPA